MAPRVRVYEARDIARNIRTTFSDRPVEYETKLPFSWPPRLQNVGDSLAVAYGSDKWKAKRNGKRPVELYKHLAESRNRALAVPGLVHDFHEPGQRLKVVGPTVSIASLPMPKHFAILGFCDSVHVKLYTQGTNRSPKFGRGLDDGTYEITMARGMLGASKILWNEVGDAKRARDEWTGASEDAPDFNQPFLFVYTEQAGVLMLIVGERLAVEKDGIVG